MYMEIRNSKTEMPLFKVKGEKFIFVGEKTIMKLSDMCIMFEDGDWIESKDQSDDGIRLLQTGNIGEGKFLEKEGKERFISRETFEKLKCKEVFSGDILISRLPEPVGRACLVPEKKQRMITAVDCTICRIDDKKIRRRYLCYYLQSANYYTQLKNSITGTTRKRISRKNLGNIEIKIPSDKKQEEVIKQLDLIVEIIDNKKKKLQLLDTLVKSRFAEMFGDPIRNPKGWKVVTIGDIVTEVRYGTSKPAVEGGKYPYLRMNNLTADGHLDLNDLKYIDISDDEVEKCVVRKGDVLFNRTNSIDLVGKTAVFDLQDDMVIAGYIIRVRLNEKILPEVLSQYMNLEALKDILRFMAKGAVNQANINAQELQSIRVYVPDIELQKQFVEMKDQVDKSKFVNI